MAAKKIKSTSPSCCDHLTSCINRSGLANGQLIPNFSYTVDYESNKLVSFTDNIHQYIDIRVLEESGFISFVDIDDKLYFSWAEERIREFLESGENRQRKFDIKSNYNFRIKQVDGNSSMCQRYVILLKANHESSDHILFVHFLLGEMLKESHQKVSFVISSEQQHNSELEYKPKNTEPQFLSKRELEVVKLISTGLSNSEIAERLFISEHTVKNHRKNILKKSGVKTTSQLIAILKGQDLI